MVLSACGESVSTLFLHPFEIDAPLVKKLLHIEGKVAFKIHLFTRGRVLKSQRLGMEGLSWAECHCIADETAVTTAVSAPQDLVATVALIGKEGMAQMLHMCSNLMGSTGFEDTFDQRHVAKPLQYTIVGYGRLSHTTIQREDGHLHAVFRMAGNVAFDAPFVLL